LFGRWVGGEVDGGLDEMDAVDALTFGEQCVRRDELEG
jgi:hypothetical protein